MRITTARRENRLHLPASLGVLMPLISLAAPLPVATLDRTSPVDYADEIVPVLKASCTACHNKTTTKGGLNMETPELMLKGGESGPAIEPRKGADSLIFQSAAHQSDSDMPPKGNKVGAVNLTPAELALLKLWIDQGAKAGEKKIQPIAWQPLPPGLNPIYAVAMSPGGELVACSRANQVFIYDVAARKLLAQFTAHRDMALALTFSPDGSRLATGSYGEVKLWKAGSPMPAPSPQAQLTHALGLASLDITHYTAEVAAQEKELASIRERIKKAADALTDSRKKLDEKREALKTASTAKAAAQKALDDATAALAKSTTDPAPAKAATEARTRLDGAIKAESDATAAVKAAETSAKNAEAEPPRLNTLLTAADKLAADAKAALASAQARQKQLTAGLDSARKTPASVTTPALPAQWTLERTLGTADAASPLTDRVHALAFSPDGRTLATGSGAPSRDGDLAFWETSSGRLQKSLPGRHSDTVLCLDWSPDGRLIASGGADKQLRITDVTTGRLLKTFEGHTHHVMGVHWRADGRMLATSGADNVVKTWDWLKGERRRNLDGWDKEVTGVRYLGTSTRLITASGDRQVRLIGEDAASPALLPGPADFMHSIAASQDGTLAASGGEDSVLRLWEVQSRTALAAFPKP